MIGLPILSGFIGEFLILSGTFGGVSRGWAVAASMGVILGATYMLSLVQKIFYGPQSELVSSRPAGDLHFRELAVLCPIVALTVVMGVAPHIWLPAIKQSVRALRNYSVPQSVPPDHVLRLSPSFWTMPASSQEEDKR